MVKPRSRIEPTIKRIIPDSKERLSKMTGFNFGEVYSRVFPRPDSRTISLENFRRVYTLIMASDYSFSMISRMLNVSAEVPSKINRELNLRSKADIEAIKKFFQRKSAVKVIRVPHVEKPLSFWQRGLELLIKDTTLKPKIRLQLIRRARVEIARLSKLK